MSEADYLASLLAENKVLETSREAVALRGRRAEIEAAIRIAFEGHSLSVRYGGSKAKGTMVLVSYDLDLTCYFSCDDERSLEEIFGDVKDALDAAGYRTVIKTSAIRVRGGDDVDFHVDVVPGRFFDKAQADVWLYQTQGKDRLKTNLDVHIEHVRNSGVRDAICLMKLWRHRFALGAFRTFALELLTIKALRGWGQKNLDVQLRHVLEELAQHADSIAIEDPANGNNDLSGLLDTRLRAQLKAAAQQTLAAVTRQGWEAVLGPLSKNAVSRRSTLAAAASGTVVRTRPWLPR
jgi:hypothetical protein